MGYLHIDLLHKALGILEKPEVYALEKVHGTSAHLRWSEGLVFFHHGGVHPPETFAALFDVGELAMRFAASGRTQAIVYGEAYGGKLMRMSATYGPNLRFVAFDVKIGDDWLDVPSAAAFVEALGLDFVHWVRTPTDLPSLNALRDAPSVQAVRCGIVEPRPREGIVLRPLVEAKHKNGKRVIAKYKIAQYGETKTPREVSAAELQVLSDANDIAEEFVTENRMDHILSKMPAPLGPEATPAVIRAMLEDIRREGEGEIEWTPAANRAIGRNTAQMFKARLKAEAS